MALSENAALELAKKNSIDPESIKKAAAKEMTGSAKKDDTLRIPFRIGVTLNRSMAHASRFFRELRDNGIFYAAKCPVCGHVLFPPVRPVCLRCIKKGELVEYEPLEMGPEVEGTVAAVSKLVRGTSKDLGKGDQYPCLVKVDGADNAHWQFVVPTEGGEIEVGAHVRSVLADQADRTGEVSDYAFRLI
ncbi:zinc ribbon domain-containing protein [Thermodesulfobacteriota bacterium]